MKLFSNTEFQPN